MAKKKGKRKEPPKTVKVVIPVLVWQSPRSGKVRWYAAPEADEESCSSARRRDMEMESMIDDLSWGDAYQGYMIEAELKIPALPETKKKKAKVTKKRGGKKPKSPPL